ncbi:MAG: Tex family protein [Bacteroidales bacterium]
MNSVYISFIHSKIGVTYKQVVSTIQLLKQGATVPFIARYRKEHTDGLDEVQIRDIQLAYEAFEQLDARKKTVLKSIDEQGALTDELRNQIESVVESQELEDLYVPYKPKKRTRASIAKQKGLEPLAAYVYACSGGDVYAEAQKYISDTCTTREEALQGARDIIAEWFQENKKVRAFIRNIYNKEAVIRSKLVKGKKDDAHKYELYFDYTEALKKCPSHRLLAIMRAHKEGLLRVSVMVDKKEMVHRLLSRFVFKKNQASVQVSQALEDAYTRLLQPSMETEFYANAKKRADISAIHVFAENLRQLLLMPPYGQKRILGIDPGFRTGCKVVCVDEVGDLLHNETIYPHPPQKEQKMAIKKIAHLVATYKIDAIAIGNGTAGRETERFIQRISFPHQVQVFMVNEAGASVYSASSIARKEFPQYDVTVRGAVSIARRLMDPLAELVKIDPKSIGVGQYQHDVNQTDLKRSLDNVVESCVNKVGVELNTASMHLLAYVSGVGPTLAQKIVDYRAQHGAFTARSELMNVPKMGAKTYEQCAGFLRIAHAQNVLDSTAVHPERYALVERMAKDMHTDVAGLIHDKELRERIPLTEYISPETGEFTLHDILSELEKPGRDPREKVQVFSFDNSLKSISDVKAGAVLPGIVTNVTNFGAFVDIGIKQNGLVHISQITEKYITDPVEIVTVNQYVQVKVLSVDEEKNRIQLSMKDV